MDQAKRKRKGFVRTPVPPTEQVICIILLGLVGMIAGAVIVRGEFEKGHLWGGWDKSRYQPPTPSPTGGTTGVLPTSPPRQAVSPSEAQVLLTPDLAGPEWTALGEREYFPADRLWEKIDGQAELFLQYEVVSLEAMTYQSRQDPNLTLDVSIYHMGQPLMAFGVYSYERPFPVNHPVQIGREGYEDGGLYFWQGPFYTTIIPSLPDSPGILETMLKIARHLASQQPDDGSPLRGPALLPTSGQLPHSLKYFHRNAFGVDFMPGVFSAQYGSPDQPMEVFLTERPSPQAARETFDRYLQFLKGSGKLSTPRQEGGAAVVVCDMGGLYEWAFLRGSLIGGIKSVADRSSGEAQLKSWLAHLSKSP
jgi:hypothetical protein